MSHATAAASPLVLERMSPFQWTAIAICVLLNMLDGFDVMVMAFTAPHVSADWALSGKLLGIMLSAGWSAWRWARSCWRRWPTAGAGGR